MSMKFKCRINCTSIEQLNFKGAKINEDCINLHTHIIHDLQPENIDFIDQIQIVKKKLKKDNLFFTTKTLEFIITRELERHEFVEFIRKMKDIGFRTRNTNNTINTKSKHKSKRKLPKPKYIQFIDTSVTPMNILYNYNFITEEPDEPYIRDGLLKNRSKYYTKVIYHKK